ncbi:MAG: UDP-N-acetylmuramate dehydrogenase, partial [Opitutales bacterium]|nr:UDP-N-acetylmuramate dehydrogenase [Opitutales bacterium]
DVVFEENKCIGKMTTLGLGGNARYYAEPSNVNELEVLLRGAAVCEIPVFVLGRGSNLLVADEGFSGLVIRLSQPAWRGARRVRRGQGSGAETAEDGRDRIRVGAGMKLKELCGFAMREGLGGFEFLEGIPGTLGGALRMNAGAMGASIFDVVESVEWIMPDGTRHEARREQMNPVYRDCPELHGAIVLSAVLGSKERRTLAEIKKVTSAYAEVRRDSQPRERSAGCTFRNPTGTSAGKLIDRLGLKGSGVGGAEISEVHANFIIAKDGAKAADVVALVRRVHGIVKAEAGVDLVPEIVLLGSSWEKEL